MLLQATVKVHAQTDNVAGVKLPKFEQLESGSAGKMNLTGLGAGGQQVQSTRKVYPPTSPIITYSCPNQNIHSQAKLLTSDFTTTYELLKPMGFHDSTKLTAISSSVGHPILQLGFQDPAFEGRDKVAMLILSSAFAPLIQPQSL